MNPARQLSTANASKRFGSEPKRLVCVERVRDIWKVCCALACADAMRTEQFAGLLFFRSLESRLSVCDVLVRHVVWCFAGTCTCDL